MNDSTQPTNPPSTGQTASESSRESTSPITLAAYVNVLRRASKEILPALHKTEGPERRMVKELMDAGLLSDARVTFGGRGPSIVDSIVLTPAGASALAEWSEFLRKESFGYKAGDTLLRVLWVLVGALCALLPDIIRALS